MSNIGGENNDKDDDDEGRAAGRGPGGAAAETTSILEMGRTGDWDTEGANNDDNDIRPC